MEPGQQASPSAFARMRERSRQERRHLRFMREGKYYVFFTIGVGVAALNTGNNLLFLVLGLQLSAILISGVLSESALQGLEIRRLLPADPAARDSFAVTYLVTNRKRFWPSFALVLAEKQGPFAGQRTTVLYVGPGETASATLHASAPRRGRFELDEVVLSTRFPFGFFEKWILVPVRGELFVLPPRVRPIDRRAHGCQREGSRPERRPGHGDDLHGLRELRPGDDRRLVHWRKSAAVGRLLVVEREREQRRRVVLVLDNRGKHGPDGLDAPVARAAATARLLSGRGLEVGLATSGELLAPLPGPTQLRKLLRRLATLGDAPASAAPPNPRHEGTIVISAGGGQSE
jgi:uncharacterized protein (DUF58 family)